MYQGDLPYLIAVLRQGSDLSFWINTCKRSCKRDAPILRPLKKIYNLDSIPENSILVNANVMGLNPSELNEVDLRALGQALEERKWKRLRLKAIISIKQQISWTAIRTKFSPLCVYFHEQSSNQGASTYTIYYGSGLLIFLSSGPMKKRVLRNFQNLF